MTVEDVYPFAQYLEFNGDPQGHEYRFMEYERWPFHYALDQYTDDHPPSWPLSPNEMRRSYHDMTNEKITKALRPLSSRRLAAQDEPEPQPASSSTGRQ